MTAILTAAATRRSPRTPARGADVEDAVISQKQDRGDPDPHRSDRGYLRGRRLRRKSRFLVPRISNFDAGIRSPSALAMASGPLDAATVASTFTQGRRIVAKVTAVLSALLRMVNRMPRFSDSISTAG
jgi:hypothetical protein